MCVKRRRREAGGGGEEPGIQNQKQEPHTKMWGIILVKIRLLETIAIIKNNDNNNANKNENNNNKNGNNNK